MNRDRELWGMALWVEKNHGDNGHDFIRKRIAELANAGEHDGARLWQQVGKRFAELRTGPISIHRQAGTLAN